MEGWWLVEETEAGDRWQCPECEGMLRTDPHDVPCSFCEQWGWVDQKKVLLWVLTHVKGMRAEPPRPRR